MIVGAKFIKSLSHFDENESLNLSAVAFLGRSNVGKSSLINALCHQKNLAKSSATPGKTRLINLFEVKFKLENMKDDLDIEKKLEKEKFKINLKKDFKMNLIENSNENLEINLKENLKQNSKENLNKNLKKEKPLKNSFSALDESFRLIFVDLPGFGYARVSKSTKEEWDKNLNEYLQKENAIKLFIHLIDARHSNLSLDKEISSYLKNLLSPSQQILEVFTKADKLNQSQKTLLKKEFKNALFVSSLKKTGLKELEEELIKRSFNLYEGLNFKENLKKDLNLRQNLEQISQTQKKDFYAL